MNSRRPEKLASYIREEVAGMIQRGLDDPRLEGVLVSVTRAKVSPDLAYADVYVSLLGAETRHTAAIEALKSAAGKFRGELGKGMRTRSVPVLRFEIDEQLKKEMQVLDLIRQAEREREEREARNAPAADVSAADVSGADVSAEDPAADQPEGDPSQ